VTPEATKLLNTIVDRIRSKLVGAKVSYLVKEYPDFPTEIAIWCDYGNRVAHMRMLPDDLENDYARRYVDFQLDKFFKMIELDQIEQRMHRFRESGE
jgi:hypothetical protein